jgi:hypothetical protein
MKIIVSVLITTLLSTGCTSIGEYTESQIDTEVRFSQYSKDTNKYFKRKTHLVVAQTGLVTGSTLLYSAMGISSVFKYQQSSTNVSYPLWINESEVDEVEFAITQYRHWQDEHTPETYSAIEPVNSYVSEWMNGVTFKFGLFSNEQGKGFLSVCYEFSKLGQCTLTYMIDEQNVKLLSDDLEAFKLSVNHDAS